jgi:hypothetical protein
MGNGRMRGREDFDIVQMDGRDEVAMGCAKSKQVQDQHWLIGTKDRPCILHWSVLSLPIKNDGVKVRDR